MSTLGNLTDDDARRYFHVHPELVAEHKRPAEGGGEECEHHVLLCDVVSVVDVADIGHGGVDRKVRDYGCADRECVHGLCSLYMEARCSPTSTVVRFVNGILGGPG